MGTSKSSERTKTWTAGAALFSGRPDPTWTVAESEGRRLEQLWASLPPAEAGAAPAVPVLGYRGCWLREPGGREWHAFRELVEERLPGRNPSRRDRGAVFEKLVLATAPPGLLPADVIKMTGAIMPPSEEYHLVIGEAPSADRRPRKAEPRRSRARKARALVSAAAAVRALMATSGAAEAVARIPSLARASLWVPTASFTVCRKTGTALFLDIWDADHFDGFTDMTRCVTDCRAWFSADGYTTWDSAQTKTGRINCYFKAPAAGSYICTAQLESYGGPAQVECLIDASSFGSLPFNGAKTQPHPCTLAAGYHSFRIRQQLGSFFFVGLTVWKA